MTDFADRISLHTIGNEAHQIAVVHNVFDDVERVIDVASKTEFSPARLAYPGVVAAPDSQTKQTVQTACNAAVQLLRPNEGNHFKGSVDFSIITRDGFDAMARPIRPHADGSDVTVFSSVLYLSEGLHGGTAFFRHIGTGFEAITDDRLPFYKSVVLWEHMPENAPEMIEGEEDHPRYVKTMDVPAEANSMVVFPSYILHTPCVNRAAPLPLDARLGRLTLNACFRHGTDLQGQTISAPIEGTQI